MYKFIDHTGELAVRVRADSLEELFSEAARAMNEYLAEGIKVGELEKAEEVVVEAADKDALLVAFLSEILYRIEVENKIYPEVSIQQLEEGRLEARISGGSITTLARDIKAVTHHGLNIESTDGQYHAIITFDI